MFSARPLALAILVLMVFAPRASAQNFHDAVGQLFGLGPGDSFNSSIDDVPSGHWGRCRGHRDISLQVSIRSCGRVIGERISRLQTGAAQLYRARHYRALGDSKRAHRDFESAIATFSAYILAEPRSVYGYLNRASAYESFERYEEALSDLRRATEIEPEMAHPHYRRGAILFRLGDFASATVEYDEAARKDPEQPYHHAARCEARAAARTDLDMARAACDEAIRLGERLAYPVFSRGFLRFLAGDYRAAYEDFDTSVELDETLASALYGRGVAAVRLGRQAEGEADIAQAREFDDRDVAFYSDAGLRP